MTLVQYPIVHEHEGGFRALQPGLPVRVVDLKPVISNALKLHMTDRVQRVYVANRRLGLTGSLGHIWDKNTELGLWILYPEGYRQFPSLYHYSELLVESSDKFKVTIVNLDVEDRVTRVRVQTLVGLRTGLVSLLKQVAYDWSLTEAGSQTVAALQKQGQRFTWINAFKLIPANWWLRQGIVGVELQDRDCEAITLPGDEGLIAAITR